MEMSLNASNKTHMYLSELQTDKEFVDLPCEVQTHAIIATREERANSRKFPHAADGCGTLIGLAVPSKALLVSFFGVGVGSGGWNAEKVWVPWQAPANDNL